MEERELNESNSGNREGHGDSTNFVEPRHPVPAKTPAATFRSRLRFRNFSRFDDDESNFG